MYVHICITAIYIYIYIHIYAYYITKLHIIVYRCLAHQSVSWQAPIAVWHTSLTNKLCFQTRFLLPSQKTCRNQGLYDDRTRGFVAVWHTSNNNKCHYDYTIDNNNINNNNANSSATSPQISLIIWFVCL